MSALRQLQRTWPGGLREAVKYGAPPELAEGRLAVLNLAKRSLELEEAGVVQ